MTIRDRITRVRARTPSVEEYPMAVHRRLTDPTLCGTFGNTHERRQQTNPWPAYAGSRLKLSDALGRHRRKCQPSSRTGENPPYGTIGGIEETSASCEAPVRASTLPNCEKSSSLSRPIRKRRHSRQAASAGGSCNAERTGVHRRGFLGKGGQDVAASSA